MRVRFQPRVSRFNPSVLLRRALSSIKCEFCTYNLHDIHLYYILYNSPGEWDADGMGLDRESD